MITDAEFKELTWEQKKEVMEWRAKFHFKKAKATSEMKRIPKNGFNKMHNYHYARESDVKDAVGPILEENKLSFSIDLLERTEGPPVQTKGGGYMIKTSVKMLFKVTDTETGYYETFRHDGDAMDTGDKGVYKGYSNTIKYALMDYFLIPTGDDVEKESPEINPHDFMNEQPNQQPQGRSGRGQTAPKEKDTWRKIMDAEDELVNVTGSEKATVRKELENKFGRLPKYKEMEEGLAVNVLAQLNKWIDGYKFPQG